ncbi:RidA family protein [Streptomyces kronopolitis]|uniref:RidA family protein n=1 Tax=Streptomyces kronopolitis TaxID=1612435 RepID=UPI003439C76E
MGEERSGRREGEEARRGVAGEGGGEARYGTGPRPCRTTVMVGLPRPGMLVEIDAQAVVGP